MAGNDVGASTHPTHVAASHLRRAFYWLLIVVTVGQVSGRLLATNSIDRLLYDNFRINEELEKSRKKFEADGTTGGELTEKMRSRRAELESKLRLDTPTLSANDRSRWDTVRSLVEYRTYEIDAIITDEQQHKMWGTIDMVKHYGPDGQGHLYSSKPPLLATLVAGPYWVLYHGFGLSMRDQPHAVVRILLLLFNVIPMAVYLWLLAGIVERYAKTDYARLLVMVTAAFGTFLTTFAVTLNNHLHAAIFVTAALYAVLPVWYDGQRRWRYFVVAGFCAAMAAASELPALAFCAAIGVALLWKAPLRTLLGFVPAALVVVAAWAGTNYASHGTIRPAYDVRDFTAGPDGKVKDWTNGNWYNYDYYVGKVKKQSYWSRDPESMARRSAIDRGEPSRARYAFHCLIGHHGIFSLTPVWLLSVVGALMMMRRRESGRVEVHEGTERATTAGEQTTPSLRAVGVLVAILSVVCVVYFTVVQGTENRNYGGGTSGLRWTFWLIPLWLVAMLPAADWVSHRRWARVVAGVLLALSVLSASCPIWNPWTSPWISQWMTYMGWQ